jgi:hypothetical protein
MKIAALGCGDLSVFALLFLSTEGHTRSPGLPAGRTHRISIQALFVRYRNRLWLKSMGLIL